MRNAMINHVIELDSKVETMKIVNMVLVPAAYMLTYSFRHRSPVAANG